MKPRLANSSIRNMQRYPWPSGLLLKVLMAAVIISRSHVPWVLSFPVGATM